MKSHAMRKLFNKMSAPNQTLHKRAVSTCMCKKHIDGNRLKSAKT